MRTDILIGDDYDLQIVNNDLVLGESTNQHQKLLLVTFKGDWKEQPAIGIATETYLKDEADTSLQGVIKQDFEKDGMKVNAIGIYNGNIEIDAYYPN